MFEQQFHKLKVPLPDCFMKWRIPVFAMDIWVSPGLKQYFCISNISRDGQKVQRSFAKNTPNIHAVHRNASKLCGVSQSGQNGCDLGFVAFGFAHATHRNDCNALVPESASSTRPYSGAFSLCHAVACS